MEWFEYLDWGKSGGRTFEDGKVALVHPENWKRGRKYNSERRWIQTVYHEMGHYVLWADAERKAEAKPNVFARAWRSVSGAASDVGDWANKNIAKPTGTWVGENAPAVPLPQAQTTLSRRLSFGRWVRSAI